MLLKTGAKLIIIRFGYIRVIRFFVLSVYNEDYKLVFLYQNEICHYFISFF